MDIWIERERRWPKQTQNPNRAVTKRKLIKRTRYPLTFRGAYFVVFVLYIRLNGGGRILMIRIDELNTHLLRSRTPSAGDSKTKEGTKALCACKRRRLFGLPPHSRVVSLFPVSVLPSAPLPPPRPAASASFVFKSCSCGTGGWFAV